MSNVVRQRKEGEPKIVPNGEPTIFCQGRIGAIVHYPVLVDHGQGYVEKTFEKFVRSPGTRIIVLRDNQIYLQKEKRIETGDWDWRLPGGKVIDTFEQFTPYIHKEIPEAVILEAGKRELREEAGLEADEIRLFDKKACGATVEWDLYYLVAEDIVDHHGKAHHEGEEIEEGKWCGFDEARTMCESGQISEGRTVAVLVKFLASR